MTADTRPRIGIIGESGSYSFYSDTDLAVGP
ncbi:UNVERIFIED_CONTAM: hypothetical protein DES50_104270 [Williamsia faeni]